MGSGNAAIYGCTISVSVWYIPAIRSLIVQTKGSGYMTAGTQGECVAKAFTLTSECWPSGSRIACLDSNAQLKFSTSVRVGKDGAVSLAVTAAEPMRGFGWPETEVLIPL